MAGEYPARRRRTARWLWRALHRAGARPRSADPLGPRRAPESEPRRKRRDDGAADENAAAGDGGRTSALTTAGAGISAGAVAGVRHRARRAARYHGGVDNAAGRRAAD